MAQPAKPTQNPQYLGAGSCSASACHNANVARGPAGSEYTTWITRDPHARAYEALFDERSIRMQRNLGRQTPAHDDQRCLKCHVAPEYDVAKPPPLAPYFKTDGVSCESCHGPAKDWVALHHLDGWRATTSLEKKRLGMNDTQSLPGRAQVCVTCHVGAAGMDVDHDLIAAGHPRLHFEFAAFHAFMPRHWSDAKDRDPAKHPRGRADFEARAWALGQLATAHASLELLADRAANRSKPWPEFAEHDCAACHKELRGTGALARKARVLGWGHQVALTPRIMESIPGDRKLAAELAELERAMNAGMNPNRTEVTRRATSAARLLRPWLDDFRPKATEEAWMTALLDTLLAGGKNRSRDEATQTSLAIAALERARAEMRWTLPANVRKSLLNFARDVDHAPPYEPRAIRARLEELKTIGAKRAP